MSSELDTENLSKMLNKARGNRGLRDVAEEIGNVSASTLSRIEQGKVPDVDTFIRICNWLEVPTSTFVRKESEKETNSHFEEIQYHLRASKELDKETLSMLQKVVKLAYNKF